MGYKMKSFALYIIAITYFLTTSFIKFELPCRADLLEKSKEIALSESGARESTGRNDGADIEKYLESVGAPKGAAYCAAGQFYCFVEAARVLGIDEREIPIPKSALAKSIFDRAALVGLKARSIPSKHDLIIWRRGSGIFGHVERVVEYGRAGNVLTVAFNVAGESGEGVYLKRRNVFSRLQGMNIRGVVGFYKSN